MRDAVKDKEYFLKQIEIYRNSLNDVELMIRSGKVVNDKVNFMKRISVSDTLNIIHSHYSSGLELSYLETFILKGIKLVYESWDGFWMVRSGTPNGEIILNQYSLEAYDEMLWMLSLGYLLDIENEEFQKLVDVIDRDQVKDYLFEFVIKAKLPDRKTLEEESYREYYGVPAVFKSLREAIRQTDKEKSQELIKLFLEKEWYPNHKDAGWYNSHQSKNSTYFGYWSFESAAVTCIMDLDDSSYRDNEYYPKDLVDFYRDNHS